MLWKKWEKRCGRCPLLKEREKEDILGKENREKEKSTFMHVSKKGGRNGSYK